MAFALVVPPGILVVGLYLLLVSAGPISVPETEPSCVAAEETFAGQLAKDPLITLAPPGMTQVSGNHAQPCIGIEDSAHIGGAYAVYAYPGKMETLPDVYGFYRQAGQANGWRMSNANPLCGVKVVQDRPLRFLLTLDGDLWERYGPSFIVEIHYEGIGESGLSCEP